MKKTITFSDEAKYTGDVKNGKPHGSGTLVYPDKGGKYEGEWKNGKYHGKGKLTYYDGGIYYGDFKNGKCDGYGEFKIRGGDNYKGAWKDGKYHGHGTLIWKHWDETSKKTKNEKYTGQFEKGEIYIERTLNWQLLENETEEDYRFRVLNEFDYKNIKKKFDIKRFIHLLDDEKDIFNLILKSCEADSDILSEDFSYPNSRIIDSSMYGYVDEIIYNNFLPKINSNFSYTPVSCCYYYSETLWENWFSKLDILNIKKKNKIYIIESGFIRNDRYYCKIIKTLNKKINKNILINELINFMKKSFFLPGVIGLSGAFKWNMDKIFSNIKPHEDSLAPNDLSEMEENSFIFLSNNAKNYKYCRPILDSQSISNSEIFNVWSESNIEDSIEEQKVNKKFRKIIKTKFKNHYQFNVKSKKWEECDIFSDRE